MMSGSLLQFVKAIYPYTGQDQGDLGLPMAESAVIYIAERLEDGWCRGYSCGREGWFPASYTKTIMVESAFNPHHLSLVLRSKEWAVYATPEDKVYFVNQANQTTSWGIPQLQNGTAPGGPTTPTTKGPTSPSSTNAAHSTSNSIKEGQPVPAQGPAKRQEKSSASKPRLVTINNLTFADGGDKQPLLQPNQPSYVDYFWSDKLDKSGFDFLLAKHINGKMVMKDIIDFMKERAAIEDAYAKSLSRLSKSTLGSQEEGTLLHAWHSVKTELASRASVHADFANKLNTDFNKQMFEYKESQKKDRKQHEIIVSQDRKQLQQLDGSIDKAKQMLVTKQKDIEARKLARKTSLKEIEVARRKSSYASEELKRLEESYNDSQRKWVDDMIAACQDMEEHEQERSKFLQSMFYKYIDLHIAVHEKSGDSLSKVTDAVDSVNSKTDRDVFIRKHSTGTQRPVDRR